MNSPRTMAGPPGESGQRHCWNRVRAGPGSRCSCVTDGGTVAGCSPFLRHVSGYSLVWSTTSTFQFLGVVDVSDALVSGRSLSVVRDRAQQRFMEQNIRRKSPRRSFTKTLSTLSITGVCGGPLGSGLAGMSAGGWLRQTDKRMAPQSGGRRGFYVKENSDPEVVGLTLACC